MLLQIEMYDDGEVVVSNSNHKQCCDGYGFKGGRHYYFKVFERKNEVNDFIRSKISQAMKAIENEQQRVNKLKEALVL